MTQWYYAKEGQQYGPVGGQELKELAKQGELQPTDLIWKEGLSDWVTAREVQGLFAKSEFDVAPPTSPPPAPSPQQQVIGRTLRCHEVSYEIHGDDMQLVEVELDPGETVIAEAGAMNYLDSGISYEARMGDGSQADEGLLGKLFSGAKRMITGESIFLTHFTNNGASAARVAFAGPYPGKIIPMDMARLGGEILCQKDAFLAAAYGTEVGIAFNRRLGRGFFGGEGFILQRLRGDGLAFVHAGGHIIEKRLSGETLLVDTGCLVAFTPEVDYDIQMAGGLKTMIFGGEGLFMATLRGHGTVWLQTLPFSRLANRILANAPSQGGRSTGEGSVLGGLGDLFGDR